MGQGSVLLVSHHELPALVIEIPQRCFAGELTRMLEDYWNLSRVLIYSKDIKNEKEDCDYICDSVSFSDARMNKKMADLQERCSIKGLGL